MLAGSRRPRGQQPRLYLRQAFSSPTGAAEHHMASGVATSCARSPVALDPAATVSCLILIFEEFRLRRQPCVGPDPRSPLPPARANKGRARRNERQRGVKASMTRENSNPLPDVTVRGFERPGPPPFLPASRALIVSGLCPRSRSGGSLRSRIYICICLFVVLVFIIIVVVFFFSLEGRESIRKEQVFYFPCSIVLE